MNRHARIYIAGHLGMVGAAISRVLERCGYQNLLCRTRDDLDLRNHEQVMKFFADTKPEYVFLAAAKVGGILANSTLPADNCGGGHIAIHQWT